MTIKVSSINEYLYCPLKLYLRNHLELEEIENEQTFENKNYNKILSQLNNDFRDILRRNLMNVNKDMSAAQISETLFNDVPYLLKKSLENYEFTDDNDKNLLFNELEKDLKVENTILALKIHRILIKTKKDARQIVEMIFPPSLQSYLMRDKSLEISGNIDKIEIVNGKYYPISRKLKNPPIRGVWDSDALEIAAYGLLIEREFDTEVMVGFVDYERLGDRRPVVIDSDLREGLFIVIDAIREIINLGDLPEVNINPKKCEKCSYMEICNQNLDFS
ncbi:MAG: Dna2/Cas4 domain-containing protein [Methanobacteriaceae archaeon]|nr:Dna2/Cas4 domain-containing protein [Methanobacteriaceae archaeon]MDP2836710.1 Dna2/Cas4 domain-containing protein [Methanobacteriaceae archaeon]MDP3034102.1 Dna2/Cas4 domain-containing protein [Methanobacteriaceae archaeon]MDP3485034.1 Dna2/Cas4 domain-containing protein [Methanobacteriaceae archaeon]MDP3623060.1 Dna2/Cas4 domain-containing protein [Methanobacteriaceae archaeon]